MPESPLQVALRELVDRSLTPDEFATATRRVLDKAGFAQVDGRLRMSAGESARLASAALPPSAPLHPMELSDTELADAIAAADIAENTTHLAALLDENRRRYHSRRSP